MKKLASAAALLACALAWAAQCLGAAHGAAWDAPPAAGARAAAAGARASAAERIDAADVARPYFRVVDERNGLPQNSIQTIAFDRNHYLWVATQDGAAYFNGRAWTVVNMPNRTVSNYIDGMVAAPDGSMWFGTEGGGVCQYKAGTWAVYDGASGLPDTTVVSLCVSVEDDGSYAVLAGTGTGVYRLADGAWTALAGGTRLATEYVLSLTPTRGADGSEVIWAGGSTCVGKYEHGAWTIYDESSGLPPFNVKSMLVTADAGGATTVLAGSEKGLYRLDGERWVLIPGPPDRPPASVRCIAESASPDGDPVIWVGTGGGGLARLERGRWTVLDEANGFPNDQVESLLATVSPDGIRMLWVGTNGAGLAYMKQGDWLSFDMRTGVADDEVMSLLETIEPDGTPVVWMGTSDGGLSRLENGRWSVFDKTSGLPANRVKSLFEATEADGTKTLWVGTRAGLARREGAGWRTFDASSGLPHGEILSFAETATEGGGRALWVGTGGGIACYEGGAWKQFTTANSGLPNNRVQSLLATRAPDGSPVLWAGTNGGLARLQGGQWEVFGPGDGLANKVVLSLHETTDASGRKRLWAGTFAGVSIYDEAAGAWTTISDSTVPALPNNDVYGIVEDRAGRLYLSTNKGVARLTPRAPTPDDPAEYAIYTFSTEEGLPGAECNMGAWMSDHAGRVWVGTPRGAALFDPARETQDRAPKPLVVEHMRLGGEDRPVAHGDSFAHFQNDLGFEYTLLSYVRPDATRYRTQLIGLNDHPSDWSVDYKRDYPSLPAGTYVFRVWGRDYAGNVSGPIDVAFTIRPAPWRTWWAYALYTACLAAAVYAIVRMRLQALRRANVVLEGHVRARTAELAEKVQQLEVSERKAHESETRAIEASRAKSAFLANMSHELRTPLNAILGFVQLMERDTTLDGEQRENLGIIARSGEHLLGLINDVLSLSKIEAGQLTLNPHAFDLPRMLQGLEEMFWARAEERRLQFLFEIDPKIPPYVYGDEGKLRQVLINLLGNAFKFTETGGVALRSRWQDDVCSFEVEDTGEGINAEEMGKLFTAFVQTETGHSVDEGTGLGLAISRNFVHLMDGDIFVRSEPGRGTTFSFQVRMPAAIMSDAAQRERKVVGLEDGQPPVTVLVVDDRWENRALLVKLLTSVGVEVREAADGREAVDVAAAWRPRLIWMDIRMPVMDGYEATRRIRMDERDRIESEAVESASSGNRAVIIALTASAFEHDRKAILAAGCDDFLAKPFRESSIFEMMTTHLGVRFQYADPHPPAEKREAGSTSIAAGLASMPPEIVAQLNEAVVQGDVDSAYRLIDVIRSRDEMLAEELRGMVRAYRFDDILEIIETV